MSTERIRIGGSWRSLRTGHRVTVDGIRLRQTREQSPWTWLTELRDRRRARLVGRWTGLDATAPAETERPA